MFYSLYSRDPEVSAISVRPRLNYLRPKDLQCEIRVAKDPTTSLKKQLVRSLEEHTSRVTESIKYRLRIEDSHYYLST